MTLNKERNNEVWIGGLLFLFFFLIIATFQILKPLKAGLFIEWYGARIELYAKLINILVAALGVGAFTLLYNRFQRQRLIYVLSLGFLGGFVLLSFSLSDPGPITIWSFYFLVDLEIGMMVAAFWAYLTEVASTVQATRLFGPIGAGGVLGGWVGITLAKLLLEQVGSHGLLLLAAALMGTVIVVVLCAETLIGRSPAFIQPYPLELEKMVKSPTSFKFSEALEGARLLRRSKYLAAIAAIMGTYEIASQLLDYQFKLAAEGMSGVRATQAFITDVYLYASLLSVFAQFFLVGLVMRKFGLGVMLLILPVAIIGGSLGFLAMPTLAAVSLLVIFDNGLNYSVQQTGRESLYLITRPEEKYKARAFITMFVQRLAKGVSIVAVIGLSLSGITPQYLSLLTIGGMVLMLYCSVYAGRYFAQASKEEGEPLLLPDATRNPTLVGSG
jgi:AAA family ATP:ADP antiporter